MFLLIIHYKKRYPKLAVVKMHSLNLAIEKAYKNARQQGFKITGFSFNLINSEK